MPLAKNETMHIFAQQRRSAKPIVFANVCTEVRGFAGFFSINQQKGLNNSQTN
jgi:hypothetical protein